MLARGDLARLIDGLHDGVVVLGKDAEITYVNRAGRAILGKDEAKAVSALLAARSRQSGGSVEVSLQGRIVELLALPLDSPAVGSEVLMFRDVTDLRRHESRLTTFSRTSASLAFAETLTAGLDALARDVRNSTDMDSCTFLLMEPDGELRQVGMSGDYPMAADYGNRIKACRERGAPLLALQAMVEGRPLVVSGWRQQTLKDPRFGPLHDVSRNASWDTIAVIPLVIRGEMVGVFNGFYLPGKGPSESEIAFLSAIADQAAVAVDNARLLVELERRATLDERHRLARELHDSVSQALFSMTLQARAVEVLASRDCPPLEAVRDGLAAIRELTMGALAEMRALIFQLRPEALHEEGLVASIKRHAAAVAAREGVEIQVDGPPALERLSTQQETELFRVVVEAITNAVKHAAPTKIVVELVQEADASLRIAVIDDGKGFDTTCSHPGHLGLTSMSERVAGLGGTLDVHSSLGGPTAVRAHLPRLGVLRSTKITDG